MTYHYIQHTHNTLIALMITCSSILAHSELSTPDHKDTNLNLLYDVHVPV
mgnify:CR=1 FL=1